MSGIESKRIEFEDGTWWEIVDEISFGVSRKLARTVAKHDSTIEAAFEANVVVLIDCTIAWSFANEVSEEELEKIPSWKAQHMLKEMDNLYDLAKTPEEKAERVEKEKEVKKE